MKKKTKNEHETGDGIMAGYLIISVVAGFACAAVSYFGFGMGLLPVVLWYIAGCWAGFAAAVLVFLLRGSENQPLPQWQQRSATR